MKLIKLLLLLIILSVMISSCEKELDLLDNSKNTATAFRSNDKAIEKAKSIFYGTEGASELSVLNACEEVVPMWDYGRTLNSDPNNQILVIPIEIPIEAYEFGIGAQLVFYDDDRCETPFELVLYNASEELKSNKTPLNNSSFSGSVYVINVCDQTTKMYGLQAGKVFKAVDHIIEEGFFCEEVSGSRNFIKWLFGYQVKCPKLKDSWWSSLWRDLGSWFKSAWLWWLDLASDGNGGYVHVPNGNKGFPGYGGDSDDNNDNTDNGDNGGGSSDPDLSLAQLILSGNYFGGDVSFAIKLFDRFREENDLFGCKEEILALYLECLVSHDIIDIPTLNGPDDIGTRGFGDEDGGAAFDIGGMIDDLFNAADSECLAQLTTEYGQDTYDVQIGENEDAICFVTGNNNYGIPDEVLYGIAKEHCPDLSIDCIRNYFKDVDKSRTQTVVFIAEYNLSLSVDELFAIIDGFNIKFATQVLFNTHSARKLAVHMHNELSATYADYALENVNIDAFIAEHGADKYIAVSTVFKAFKVNGVLDFIDAETVEFYIEMLQTQFSELLGVAVTFIPYGIGDIADIYQSCQGSFGWACSIAIAGVIVPFDEIYSIFKNSDKFKAAWKTAKGLKGLAPAWKKLKFHDVRLNTPFLGKVADLSTSLQDKVKSLYTNLKHPAGFKNNINYDANINGTTVHFDGEGFPDFTSHSPGVEYKFGQSDYPTGFDRLKGDGTDFTKANNWAVANDLADFEKLQNGQCKINGVTHTWHHHQDGRTMFPVPTELHGAARHSGGKAVLTGGLEDLFDPPSF